jgi:hypothetical protein
MAIVDVALGPDSVSSSSMICGASEAAWALAKVCIAVKTLASARPAAKGDQAAPR